MKKIGFTGTRKGMTLAQRKTLAKFLTEFSTIEFHHGNCIGADSEAHQLVKAIFQNDCYIVLHPPICKDFTANWDGDESRRDKSYLERNKDIVAETNLLIACPAEPKNKLRSGTWSTVRYALKHNKTVRLITPNGRLQAPVDEIESMML